MAVHYYGRKNEVILEIQGMEELKEQLKSFGSEVETRGLRSATLAGARVVYDAALRSFHPGRSAKGEPPGIYRGFLKANLITKRMHTEPHVAQYAVMVRGTKMTKITKRRRGFKKGKYGGVAGPATYGRFLEFGTSKMAPRPFLTPAYFNNLEKIVDRIKHGLERAIDRASKKLK